VIREPRPYKMSFSTGGLFLNESIEVARLHGCTVARLHGCTVARLHGCTVARLHGCMVLGGLGMKRLCALAEGLVSLPKTASQPITLREIANRISTLTDDELALLIEAEDRTE